MSSCVEFFTDPGTSRVAGALRSWVLLDESSNSTEHIHSESSIEAAARWPAGGSGTPVRSPDIGDIRGSTQGLLVYCPIRAPRDRILVPLLCTVLHHGETQMGWSLLCRLCNSTVD